MKVNRRKELFPNVSDEQWNDWKWQVKNRIETYEELSKYFTFDPAYNYSYPFVSNEDNPYEAPKAAKAPAKKAAAKAPAKKVAKKK